MYNKRPTASSGRPLERRVPSLSGNGARGWGLTPQQRSNGLLEWKTAAAPSPAASLDVVEVHKAERVHAEGLENLELLPSACLAMHRVLAPQATACLPQALVVAPGRRRRGEEPEVATVGPRARDAVAMARPRPGHALPAEQLHAGADVIDKTRRGDEAAVEDPGAVDGADLPGLDHGLGLPGGLQPARGTQELGAVLQVLFLLEAAGEPGVVGEVDRQAAVQVQGAPVQSQRRPVADRLRVVRRLVGNDRRGARDAPGELLVGLGLHVSMGVLGAETVGVGEALQSSNGDSATGLPLGLTRAGAAGGVVGCIIAAVPGWLVVAVGRGAAE
eukprot:CAMPEP_0176088434 /NCGR_PEP_ID=MMETSP0120_2-20121206/44279_1 /TAXON_ID=160619 /ORGANISM="Kryptoperidinium foliaceum, Strain CCMP 1326" /LENGTH=330 /DNA_ID=CAMNT_0017422291 /DNA_START=1 /DNA_END=991 /DNA_ORIENTATION=-